MNNFLDKKVTLPANWKIYLTSIIGIFVAVNTQLHYVSPNIQDALFIIGVFIGFLAINSTQNLQAFKLRTTRHFKMVKNEVMEKAALNDAFKEEINILFSKLCDDYSDANAIERFTEGLVEVRAAYQDASNHLN